MLGASPFAWLSACFLLVEGKAWRENNLGCLLQVVSCWRHQNARKRDWKSAMRIRVMNLLPKRRGEVKIYLRVLSSQASPWFCLDPPRSFGRPCQKIRKAEEVAKSRWNLPTHRNRILTPKPMPQMNWRWESPVKKKNFGSVRRVTSGQVQTLGRSTQMWTPSVE